MKDESLWGIERKSLETAYSEAVNVVREAGIASTSMLQRKLKVGYVFAASLMDLMEERGVIGEKLGPAPRKVL